MIINLAFLGVGLMIGGSFGGIIGLYHAPACARREIRRLQQFTFSAIGALQSCRRNRDVWMGRALAAERQLRDAEALARMELETWGGER